MKRKNLFGLLVSLTIAGTATAQVITNDSTTQTYLVDSAFVYAALNEVTVRAERPVVKVQDGKLTYDMPRLLADKMVSNAYESLLQLPGVTESNGSLTLAGTHSLTIILNDRPTTLTAEQLVALLKSTPASRVEKAEVMYAAPPRLHVRGGVINLVLKGYREGEGGWQGEVNADYSQQFYAQASGGASLLYTSSRWSLDFLYNTTYEKERSDIEIRSLHTLDGITHDIRQQNIGYSSEAAHHVRMGVDYTPHKDSKLSLAYTGAFTPDGKSVEAATGNFSNSLNNSSSRTEMHNASLDYTAAFGLNAGVNYTFYRNRSRQHFSDGSGEDENRFLSRENQWINRWKLYADQSHSLSGGWGLDYGLSWTYAGNRNSQRYELEQTGTNPMPTADSYSNNREYTLNLYGGFSKSFGESLSLQASLAAEHYRLGDYRKWALYPNMELTWSGLPGHTFQLSFSTDKRYPDYWSLQESVGYMNRYMEVHGNPLLRPSTDYCATLNYILKGKYIASLSYDRDVHHFDQLAYQSSERLTLIYKTLNWDYLGRLSLTLVAPFRPTSWWNAQLTGQLSHSRARCDDYFDTSFDHKRWIAMGQWRNYFTLSKQPYISLELTGVACTPQIQGAYRIAGVWALNAALKWTSPNQKAEVLLKGNNLFDTMQPDVRIRNGLQHLDMDLFMDNRIVSLSFRYRFGGYKEKERKEVDTSRFR